MGKLFRTAQEAPAPPMAPAPAPPAMDPMALGGGMPPMPPMGMPTDPMAAAAPAPMPPPPPGERQEIIGPISSPSQMFYDMDLARYIQNNLQLDADALAKKVWEAYGGKPNGQEDASKTGTRTDSFTDNTPEQAQAERTATENSKWKRLEAGKTIADIVSYDDLGKIVSGLIFGVIQKVITQSMAPPGGAAMASNRARIIIAKNLEREYLFKQSDAIIKEIFKN
jgi:hypothetical protein